MLSCYLLLQNSKVQTFLTQKIANRFSEELHCKIEIGKVDVSFLLDIYLKDVSIQDQKLQPLLIIDELKVDLDKIHLNKNHLEIKSITLTNPSFNLYKQKSDSSFNYQFLINYFQTTDTASARDNKSSWSFDIKALKIKNGTISYNDYSDTSNVTTNNIHLTEINLITKNISSKEENIAFNISSFSFKDSHGFSINTFKAQCSLSSNKLSLSKLLLETKQSRIDLNVSLTFNNLNDILDSINNVSFTADIRQLSLNTSELGKFISVFKGSKDQLSLSGEFHGKLNNLQSNNVCLSYNYLTKINGDFSVSGLPDIEKTYMNLAIQKATFNILDLNYSVLASLFPTILPLPEPLNQFEEVVIKGNFKGFYNQFIAKAVFNTNLGSLTTDLTVKRDRAKHSISYDGKVFAYQFDIGKLFSIQDYINKLSLAMELHGSGISLKDISASIDGVIDSLDFKGNNYNSITINGDILNKKFNGSIAIKDELINMNVSSLVDFNQSLPIINIDGKIDHAKLAKLQLFERDPSTDFSTNINVHVRGNNIDNITGTINISNSIYKENKDTLALKHLDINIQNDGQGLKTHSLRSDLVDADLKGEYIFRDIYSYFITNFLSNYAPSFSLIKNQSAKTITDENFDFSIHLKNLNPISKLFIPSIHIASNSTITGHYNSTSKDFSLNGFCNSLQINDRLAKNLKVDVKANSNELTTNANCQRLYFSDSVGVDSVNVFASICHDTVRLTAKWNNKKESPKNKGDIESQISFLKNHTEVNISKANVFINDSLWTTNNDNAIIIDSSTLYIKNLFFQNNKQFIKLNGVISQNPLDKLSIETNNFQISTLDFLLTDLALEVDGIVTGEINLFDLTSKTPNVLSNITIKDFCLDNDKLGDANIQTSWNNEQNALYAKANVIYSGNIGQNKPINVEGFYYPTKNEDNLDFTINLENFKLKTISYYLKEITSDINGKAFGTLKLNGSLNHPELTGKLKLLRTSMKIDYLNTEYTFADEIDFGKDYIGFDNLVLYDPSGNTAIMNGKILHTYFNDMHFDFDIQLNNFQCLNTTTSQNEQYYGKATATGQLKITGDYKNVIMEINAVTDPGTTLFIPIGNIGEISENNFIHFITTDTINEPINTYTDLSGITLNFNLTITPDASIHIVSNAPMGGDINATGSGNLLMRINTLGDFQMFGDYIISDGDYLFAFQNILNKHFKIENGSTIKWNGDPYDATIHLKALYKLKAPISDLIEGDSSSSYNKRISVESILALQGKLFNPDINFNIDLPNSDENTRSLVYNAIDTTNEQQMVQQTFSLLVMNRFLPNERRSYENSISQGVGLSSSELITNQINGWLSQISNDFDIGVNYRPGDALTSDELEVAMSTQLFNDRVTIDGNIGVGGTTTNSSQNTSNLVGDVNVEVKIDDQGKFRIKAFNRANNNDLLNINAPYTQGAGLFYRKEFNNFNDLFQRKKKIQ